LDELVWTLTRLEPKPPFFISSVDSGNLVASLWTLQHGCLDRLRRPLLSKELAEGLLDHLRALVKLRALPKRMLSRNEAQIRDEDWLTPLLNFPLKFWTKKKSRPESASIFRHCVVSWTKRDCGWRVSAAWCKHICLAAAEVSELSKNAEGSRPIGEVPLQKLPD